MITDDEKVVQLIHAFYFSEFLAAYPLQKTLLRSFALNQEQRSNKSHQLFADRPPGSD